MGQSELIVGLTPSELRQGLRDHRNITNGIVAQERSFAGAAVSPASQQTARRYINTRETQSGFAIEFARRGYVVVELDQTGHGMSDPPVFANGFGGRDGLRYLRSCPTSAAVRQKSRRRAVSAPKGSELIR